MLLNPGTSGAVRVLLDASQFTGPFDDASLYRLRCDGVFGVVDFPLPAAKFQRAVSILRSGGPGWAVTEDMLPKTEWYATVKRRYARAGLGGIHGAMFYNETGGAPGGTVLSDAQIDGLAAKLGPDRDRIVVLTRSYDADWKPAVDRALANPRVRGVCLETIANQPPSHMDNIQVKALIDACLAKKKQFYFLSPKSKSSTPYAEVLRGYMARLVESGADLSHDDIFLVAANYDDGRAPGLFHAAGHPPGDSVESAIALYNSVQGFPRDPSKWTWSENLKRLGKGRP